MGIWVRMPDGVKDKWGSKYMKSVYNDRAAFKQAIATLSSAIKTLETYRGRLTPIPGEAQDLWDDYWSTERVIAGLETCCKDWDEAIERLTIARDNLETLVKAAEYYKSKKWGEKSSGEKASAAVSVLTSPTNLFKSSTYSSEKDVNYNC